MKKLLITTLALLLSLSLFGRSREKTENPAIVDARITYAILDYLRDEGYTVLPEVHVVAYRNPQDTIKHKEQRYSSRYETKGGRGYLLPEWANDSTWTPGSKPPQEKSNYEKYWEQKERERFGDTIKSAITKEAKPEFDDLYYQPSKDGKFAKHQKRNVQKEDTLYFDSIVKENPNITINYYDNDPFLYSHRIGWFYHGGFNYWMYSNPWYYNSYWMYDPYDWYWESRFMGYPYWNYPYYSGFYFGYNSYWGWNFGWNWYRPYYQPYYHNNYWYGGHNNYYGYNHQQPQYGRRERPSTFTQTNTTNRRISQPIPQERREVTSQQRINPQDKPTYNQTRRSYSPTYETPRMGTRPQFNNTRSRSMEMNRNTETRTSNSNERPLYTRPSSTTQERPVYSRPSTNSNTQSRTYSAPSRSSNSYNSGSMNRSSGNNYSAPSRSSSSSYSGGGSRSSGSSSGGASSSSSSSHSSSGRR